MNLTAGATIGLRAAHRTPPAPHIAAEPPEWTYAALCAQVDFEIFFPDKGESPSPAKSVCRACPVVAECLAFGMDDPYGIYGGMTARERSRLRNSTGAARRLALSAGTAAEESRVCPTCGLSGFRRLGAHRVKKHGWSAAS